MFLEKIKTMLCLLIVLTLLHSSCGTLGDIGPLIVLNTSRQQLDHCIDQVILDNPKYEIPASWRKYDDWNIRGYDFLKGKIIYFKTGPEEMYFLTIVSDSSKSNTQVALGIRAVNQGTAKWLLDSDLSDRQKKRVFKRIQEEVMPKLNKCINHQ